MSSRRGLHRFTAWVFCGLVLIISGERRLADYFYNLYALAHAEGSLQNADTLDGDEIALRLIAIDDATAAALPTAPAPALPRPLLLRAAVALPSGGAELPPLRAPPARRAPFA